MVKQNNIFKNKQDDTSEILFFFSSKGQALNKRAIIVKLSNSLM